MAGLASGIRSGQSAGRKRPVAHASSLSAGQKEPALTLWHERFFEKAKNLIDALGYLRTCSAPVLCVKNSNETA
jgi:hypothetical protein